MPKATFFAVIELVRFLQNGKTVVDSVPPTKTAALKSYAGKQDVGFNNILQSGGNNFCLAGKHCLYAVLKQSLIAKGSHCHRALCANCLGSAVTARVNAGKSPLAGTGLKISAESIAHTGYQKSDGSLCDNRGINQNYVGIADKISIISNAPSGV